MRREITIRLTMPVRIFLSCLAVLLMATAATELASENVTLTTYYPSPSGVYAKMITTSDTYLSTTASGKVGIGTTAPTNKLSLVGGNADVIGGRIGIGTTAPTQALDVAGTVRMQSFNLYTSPGDKKVLTSDANGNGTWQDGCANPVSVVTDVTPVKNAQGYVVDLSKTWSSVCAASSNCTCPSANTVACGSPLVDNCGHPCGTGTVCSGGHQCHGGGCCVPDGGGCNSEADTCCNSASICVTPACFAAGTKVLTPMGEISIEKLSVGDDIFSIDTVQKRLIPKKVTAVHQHIVDSTLQLRFANGQSLQVTAEHPFFDPRSNGYRPIGEFAVGAQVALVRANGGLQAKTDELEIAAKDVSARKGTSVYNVTVGQPFENYLAEGIIVHNKPASYCGSCAGEGQDCSTRSCCGGQGVSLICDGNHTCQTAAHTCVGENTSCMGRTCCNGLSCNGNGQTCVGSCSTNFCYACNENGCNGPPCCPGRHCQGLYCVP